MTQTTVQVTDDVAVIAPSVLTRGNVFTVSSLIPTFDLRPGVNYTGALGAWLALYIGRQSATAISGGAGGIDVKIKREIAAASNGAVIGQNMPYRSFKSQTAAATLFTMASTNAVNATSITTTAYTQANLNPGDTLFIQDSGGGTNLTRAEWRQVSYSSSTTTILLEDGLGIGHGSNADIMYNMADTFWCWLEYGSLYSIIFDYGSQTGGGNVVVAATAQVLTALLSA